MSNPCPLVPGRSNRSPKIALQLIANLTATRDRESRINTGVLFLWKQRQREAKNEAACPTSGRIWQKWGFGQRTSPDAPRSPRSETRDRLKAEQSESKCRSLSWPH